MCVTGIHVWVGHAAAMLNWIIMLFLKSIILHSQLKPSAHFNLCVSVRGLYSFIVAHIINILIRQLFSRGSCAT